MNKYFKTSLEMSKKAIGLEKNYKLYYYLLIKIKLDIIIFPYYFSENNVY